MDNGWIKLYRKSRNNPLMRDPRAWMIFCWILLTVDRKTGKMSLGRKWASSYFSMNESTFYKAIKRLEKKYKVVSLVTAKVTIKYTEVSVLNWAKYQQKTDEVTTSVTIREQSSNNQVTHIQEVENKEVRTIPKGIAYGNEDVNIVIAYMKERLQLPTLDESERVNRMYAQNTIKKFGGADKVKLLIDATAQHEFWATRITSFKQLYYKAVQIISSGRDVKGGVKQL